jgi:hypothetical protein
MHKWRIGGRETKSHKDSTINNFMQINENEILIRLNNWHDSESDEEYDVKNLINEKLMWKVWSMNKNLRDEIMRWRKVFVIIVLGYEPFFFD